MGISLKEQLIRVVEQLSEKEQRNLMEVIEKLRAQPELERGGSFLDFVIAEADPKISLVQVRRELRAIQGNLSDVIIAAREERG